MSDQLLFAAFNRCMSFPMSEVHEFNGAYEGALLEKLVFPLGGMGAGMMGLEGNGALSHVSIRHHPQMWHQPMMFSAVSVAAAPSRRR